MKKRTTLGLAFLAITIICALYVVLTELNEPECCAVCGSIAYHAPCVLDLSTGAATELAVYEPHPVKAAELSEHQSSGCLALSSENGLFMVRDPYAHETIVSLPIDNAPMNRRVFCRKCRRLLSAAAERGYVFLDLYHPDAPLVYPVKNGLCCEMRCYTVQASLDESTKEYRVVVRGSL